MAVTVVCAWCQRVLRGGGPLVSHGICPTCKAEAMHHVRTAPGRRPVKGYLVRELPVYLLDISLSGWLVATSASVPSGMTGQLRLLMTGQVYQDAVRVVRTTRQKGTPMPFVMAGEFAWGNRPGTASIRSDVPVRDRVWRHRDGPRELRIR